LDLFNKLMKTSVKRYIKDNPILTAPLNFEVIAVLKAKKIRLNKITVINVHNYLINIDDTLDQNAIQ
jgi:hypothetical protein